APDQQFGPRTSQVNVKYRRSLGDPRPATSRGESSVFCREALRPPRHLEVLSHYAVSDLERRGPIDTVPPADLGNEAILHGIVMPVKEPGIAILVGPLVVPAVNQRHRLRLHPDSLAAAKMDREL